MGYTGLLLSDMVGVDFWRTPWLVALFVASSLSCGVAVVTVADVLFAPAGADGLSRTGHMSAPALWCTGAVLTIVEAAVLVAFLATQLAFTETSRASCELLLAGSLAPLFWAGVCGAGIVLPLAAHAARCVLSVAAARLVASAGVLVGGLLFEALRGRCGVVHAAGPGCDLMTERHGERRRRLGKAPVGALRRLQTIECGTA